MIRKESVDGNSLHGQKAIEEKHYQSSTKATELGQISSDWDLVPLKLMLKSPPKYGVNAASVELRANTPVYIRITDIDDFGRFRPDSKVGVQDPRSSDYRLAPGDIVIARTGASVGKSYEYRDADGELVYAGFLIKVSPNQKELNSSYLAQYLRSEAFWSWIITNSMRSGQPGINGIQIGRMPVPVPPDFREQAAIANALSDADALIDGLENLIAKKHAIKTATMQQLLTGRTRLPPFAVRADGTPKDYKSSDAGKIPDDWEVVRLMDIAKLIHGRAHEPYVDETGEYIIVNSKFISSEGRVRKRSLKNECCAELGDVLMVLSDLPNGKALAKCFYVEEKFVYAVNQRVCIYRTKATDSKFLFYLLNRHPYFLSLDDGVTQTHILNGDIADCEVIVPATKEEQTAIAMVLSDLDRELQALELRLSKTVDIKQGMMQELLTGKTRLI